jgi:hypothetical protein
MAEKAAESTISEAETVESEDDKRNKGKKRARGGDVEDITAVLVEVE